MSSTLTSTVGLIALASAATAVAGVTASAVLAVSLRRLRRAQRAVLGPNRVRDLAAHASELSDAFETLRGHVDRVTGELDGRVAAAEQRLDGAIAHRALVRYDAYNELSGHQSLSIALLDATRSGVVLSSILHRDHARLYAKQVHGGQAELELSPEEAQAVRLALGESE